MYKGKLLRSALSSFWPTPCPCWHLVKLYRLARHGFHLPHPGPLQSLSISSLISLCLRERFIFSSFITPLTDCCIRHQFPIQAQTARGQVPTGYLNKWKCSQEHQDFEISVSEITTYEWPQGTILPPASPRTWSLGGAGPAPHSVSVGRSCCCGSKASAPPSPPVHSALGGR